MNSVCTNRWKELLCDRRRKNDNRTLEREDLLLENNGNNTSDTSEHRTEIERDHDRVLFCTAVRRLADKTQVFPLERNDSVRNRLTHSHEVSNLARSLGVALAYRFDVAKDVRDATRNIPALLAAIGLVHDLGNPPFGHQGEAAIQSWFKDNKDEIAGKQNEFLEEELYNDFLNFEGNAQTFRLVTRLQLLNDNFGLDLTYATLSAMMKYTVGSSDTENKSHVCKKKHGFFISEKEIAESVLEKVGLSKGTRHPMAYIMEACDDIAYVVLDIEDAVKKGLASFSDLMAYLKHNAPNDVVTTKVVSLSQEKHDEYRTLDLSPAELNDVSMQRFRVYAIGEMVAATAAAFIDNQDSLISGLQQSALLDLSTANVLRQNLGTFAKIYAFQHRTVLEVELRGYNTIRGLMDIFWSALKDTNPDNQKELPINPYGRYVYMRISENYRRVYYKPSPEVGRLPVKYRQCLLLTDMVSGMTDSYAVSLLDELNSFKSKK